MPVKVNTGSEYRDYDIASVNVNFKDLIEKSGGNGSLDPNSVRVVEYTKDGNIIGEVPAETYGVDFATTVIGDPWDMDSSNDIKQYGSMSNPVFTDGIMSSKTLANDGFICPVYDSDIIETQYYTIFSITMYSSVDSNDGLAVMWETPTGEREQTVPIRTYSGWHTYTIDMLKAQTIGSGTSRTGDTCNDITWLEHPISRLYILPIGLSNVDIKVDEITLSKPSGYVRFIMPGRTMPNTDRYFYIYFDTLSNGPKHYDTSWAEFTTSGELINHASDMIIKFHSQTSPLIENITFGNLWLSAATNDQYQYMGNIYGNIVSSLYNVNSLPELFVGSMRAQLKFSNLDLGSGLKANITYEVYKGSPYVKLTVKMWATNDISTPVQMTDPLFYTTGNLDRVMYRNLYNNITTLITGGNFYTSYDDRWVHLCGEGSKSSMDLFYTGDASMDANNLTMLTQNRAVIYEDQNPVNFNRRWGSDGFQGKVSSQYRYSGTLSYEIDGGSDGWQP